MCASRGGEGHGRQAARKKAAASPKRLSDQGRDPVLLAASGWQPYGRRDQLKTAQEEKDRYAAEVAAQQQENDALAADIAEGPTEEKIEEIARDELGYVKPGEYIFEPGN